MPASQPANQPAAKPAKGIKRTGPNPAHVLLTSIRNAVAAGVPASTITPMIDMALGAEGAQQAPGWRMVAGALDNATKAGTPATPASA
jgi:hypothetical protein